MEKIKLFLADDHAVLRAGLRMLLESQPDITVVGEAGDGKTTLSLATSLLPDVLLLDVGMPDMDGLGVLHAIRVDAPQCRVLLLTMHEEEAILRAALRAGASGYVLKQAAEAELLTAIRAVARGEAYVDPALTRAMIEGYLESPESGENPEQMDGLTAREIEVLTLIAEGYTNKEVADKLVVSVKTVETHKAHIAGKLGVKSRVEWLRYAREKGLLDISGS